MSKYPVLKPFIALLNSRAFVLSIVTTLIDTLVLAIPAFAPYHDELITVVTGLAVMQILKLAHEDASALKAGTHPSQMADKPKL